MTTFQDTLLINIKVVNAQANNAIDRSTKRLAMLQKRANLAAKLSGIGLSMNKLGKIIDPVTKRFVSGQEVMQRLAVQTGKKIEQSTKKINRQMLGLGLSLLFTGMALKRFAEGVTKALINTFVQLTDSTNQGFQAIQQVNAAFTFMKFAIFDALSQSQLFFIIVDALIAMTEGIANLVSKQPALSVFIGTFLAIGIVLGSVVMVMGQLLLLSVGLNISFGILLLILVIISVGLALLAVIWTSKFSLFTKLVLTLIVVMGVVLLIMALLGIAISLPWIIGIIAVGILVAAFIALVQKVGGVKNAFKALGIFLLAIFALVGDIIIEAILLPLRGIIALINLIIRAGKRVGAFRDVEEIKQPEAFTLSRKVFGLRNKLLEEAEATNIPEEAEENKVSLTDATLEKLSSLTAEKTGLNIGDVLQNQAVIVPTTQG